MASGSASGLFLSIMSPEQQQLLALSADLEAQRALLGDAVVDPALAAVRTRLNALAGDVAGVDAVDAHKQTLKQLTIVFSFAYDDPLHRVTTGHEIDTSEPPVAPTGFLLGASDQLVPFQRSASVPWSDEPTARHAVADGHAIAASFSGKYSLAISGTKRPRYSGVTPSAVSRNHF